MVSNRIVCKHFVAGFVILVNTVLMGTLQANEVESERAFDAGIKAFKAQQYTDALTHFLHARDTGLVHSKLHYNLGVTYYKLRNYALSYQELLTATQDPNMAFAAHLNAGFAALRLESLGLEGKSLEGKSLEGKSLKGQGLKGQGLAKKHFNLALTLAKTPKQLQLAQLAVNSKIKKPKTKTKAKTKKWWRASAQAKYGYNDNVTFESEKQKKMQPSLINDNSNADTYYSVYGYVGIDWFKYSNVELSAYGLDYQKINQYDNTKYNLRLNLFTYGNLFNIKLTGEYEFRTLGGEPYQERKTAALLSHNRAWKNGYIDMRYYYTDIDVDNQEKYRYLNGNLQHFEGKLWQMFGAYKKIGIAVHIENNNRQDYYDENGFLASSFSPQRKRIDIFAQYPIVKRAWLDFYTTYTKSDYPNIESSNLVPVDQNIDPNGNIIQIKTPRGDKRIISSTTLYVRLLKNVLLNVSYLYIDNTSSDDFYTYKSNVYSMGVILQL